MYSCFKKYHVTFLLTFLFFGCQNISKPDKGDKFFYNNPNQKLWAHRINSPEEANEATQNFSGIELDVIFENDTFYVKHDREENNNTTLENYWKQTTNFSQYYYWIDFKNLSDNNVKNSLNALNQLLTQLSLKDHAIVESGRFDLLSNFKQAGINTSYWVPQIQNLPENEQSQKLKSIQEAVSKYPPSALSAYYPMVPILSKNFPNQAIHIWTNGLITEEDKRKVRELNSTPAVKVILVDYENNFIHSPSTN